MPAQYRLPGRVRPEPGRRARHLVVVERPQLTGSPPPERHSSSPLPPPARAPPRQGQHRSRFLWCPCCSRESVSGWTWRRRRLRIWRRWCASPSHPVCLPGQPRRCALPSGLRGKHLASQSTSQARRIGMQGAPPGACGQAPARLRGAFWCWYRGFGCAAGQDGVPDKQ
jgi:hypothetical protein